MNEAQVRCIEQVRQVLDGTQALEFTVAADPAARYAWIAVVLRRLSYRRLGRKDRGAVLAYLERFSGYRRAQVTRLVSRWMAGRPLVRGYIAAVHAFARRFSPEDVALLATVDREMGDPSGPDIACVLRRQFEVFGNARFERLASISPAHIYNLRKNPRYVELRRKHTKTRSTRAATIGMRKAPAPEGRAGFIRIDSVHQGDQDGHKGLYHINAVDCVTQWQVVATVQNLSEAFLLPVLRQMLEQFPFVLLGFHADNGSEFVNHQVAGLLEKLRIEFTRSRPRHSNHNGLAETKNGAVVRKLFGYEHIPQHHVAPFNAFCQNYLNPFLNLHRPCLFATTVPDPSKPGRIKRVYRPEEVMTPLERLSRLPKAPRYPACPPPPRGLRLRPDAPLRGLPHGAKLTPQKTSAILASSSTDRLPQRFISKPISGSYLN